MPNEEARHQNLRFQGQYLDRDTGLHYNTFRFYDPDLGRFISPDPIGLMGGINLGSYAPNPIAWTDPWGWATRPNNGKYHSFHEFNLDSNHRYSSDAVQFNQANKNLIERMNSDQAFRRDMLGRYPELAEWMKNGDMSSSPNWGKGKNKSGLTWHHHEDTNRLVLVDYKDHQRNHGIYHPQKKGGRSLWGGGEAGRRGQLDGKTGRPLKGC